MYKPVNPKIVLRETKNNLTEVYKIGGKALTLSWAIKGKACYFWLFLLFPSFFLLNYCQWNAFLSNYYSLLPDRYWLNWWFCYKIVMVHPGTHLVKNHESQSRTNESQLKKKRVPNWKCLGLYVTKQLIWRQLDSKTLYYSKLKFN